MCHPNKKIHRTAPFAVPVTTLQSSTFCKSPLRLFEFGQPVNHLVLSNISSVSICFLHMQIIIELFMRI